MTGAAGTGRIALGRALALAAGPDLDAGTAARIRAGLVAAAAASARVPAWRRPVVRRIAAAAAVAAAVLGAGLVRIGRPGAPPAAVAPVDAAERVVAAHHVRRTAAGDPPPAVRGDEAALAAYFDETLGFRPDLPRRRSSEATIVGGQVCSLGGEAVAYVVYQWRGMPISFVARHPDAAGPLPADAETPGAHGCTVRTHRSADGTVYLAAMLPAETIDGLFEWR